MIDQSFESGSLPPETVTSLLESALRVRKKGNIPAARALLRALAAQQPDAPKVWLALAAVAETRVEQRRALERALALDPANPLARRGIARIGAAARVTQPLDSAAVMSRPDTPPAEAETLAAASVAVDLPFDRLAGPAEPTSPTAAPAPGYLTPPAPFTATAEPDPPSFAQARQAPAPAIRWPLYVLIGVSVLAVLLAAILIRPDWFARSRPAPTTLPDLTIGSLPAGASTPALAAGAAPAIGATAPIAATAPLIVAAPSAPSTAASTVPAAAAVATAAAPTTAPATAAAMAALATSARPSAVPPSPIPTPQPTPLPALAPGEVVKQGQWHAVLLRPDYAVLLDGSVGSLQPNGRFLLALVAIGNDGQAPALIPADLFALVDRAGNRYAPLPAVSTAYLDTYGRGQRGDLSMEDLIPADGGNKSVPLIFDVPPGARDLQLVVKGSALGWSVLQ